MYIVFSKEKSFFISLIYQLILRQETIYSKKFKFLNYKTLSKITKILLSKREEKSFYYERFNKKTHGSVFNSHPSYASIRLYITYIYIFQRWVAAIMIIFSTPFVQTSFASTFLPRRGGGKAGDRKFVVIVWPGRPAMVPPYIVRYIIRLLDQPTESYTPPSPSPSRPCIFQVLSWSPARWSRSAAFFQLPTVISK